MTTRLLCDYCQNDVTYSGSCMNYRIELSYSLVGPPPGQAVHDIYIYPPFDKPNMSFCGKTCIAKFIANNLGDDIFCSPEHWKPGVKTYKQQVVNDTIKCPECAIYSREIKIMELLNQRSEEFRIYTCSNGHVFSIWMKVGYIKEIKDD